MDEQITPGMTGGGLQAAKNAEMSKLEIEIQRLSQAVTRLEKSIAVDLTDTTTTPPVPPQGSKIDSLAQIISIAANRINKCADETEKL